MTKIALVTGGNRGIGLEVCRQLADRGYTVLLGSRDMAKGKQAAAKLGKSDIVPIQLDVSDTDSIQRAQEQVAVDFNVLDVLVNNAGINYDTWQNVLNADIDNVRHTLETNTLGPWQMVQVFLPLLRNSTSGCIVNVSSGGGSLESMTGGTPAYSISKLALNGLTLMLSNKLRRDRILVNAICPGWVATDMGGGGRPVPEGAAGVVWAATLPDDGPTGGFFRDRKRISW